MSPIAPREPELAGRGVVDVVIPTNRHSPYLAEALNSVAAQTYQARRVLVVDDGVPDAQVLQHLVADSVNGKVMRNTGRGLPSARNAALGATDGEFVTFLDDDDLWEPERVAALVEALEGAPHAGAAYCGGWYIDADGTAMGGGWHAIAGDRGEFLTGAVPAPRITSLMVRRSAFDIVGGFDERFTLAEDIEFILRLVESCDVVAVDRPLVRYRRHASNMTNTDWQAQFEANDRALATRLEAASARASIDDVEIYEAHRRQLRRGEAAQAGVRALALVRRRQWTDAAATVASALRLAPGPALRGMASAPVRWVSKRAGGH